jgi:transcriptional regulator with XRE-family HTH domain
MNTTAWISDLGSKPVTAADAVVVALPPGRAPAPKRLLQRVGEARRREGLTRREAARRLGVSVREVQQHEEPSADMPLSDLYRWQEALDVPIGELLSDPDGDLSPPVQLRAQLLRTMKTVRSIQEVARQASVQRLAETLVDQVLAIMPELKDTIAWPAVGHRRRQDELGQAYYRGLLLEPLDEADWAES